MVNEESQEPANEAPPTPELGVAFNGEWPESVIEQYRALFGLDLAALEGRDRLGELAFQEVPPVVERIQRMLRDLARDDWEDLPPSLTDGQLQNKLGELNQVLSEIQAFALGDVPDPAAAKGELVRRLNEHLQWFREHIAPQTVTAKAERAAGRLVGSDEAIADARKLRDELDQLEARAAEINKELDSKADLVRGLRQVSGKQSSSELAEVFGDRANELGESSKGWLKALIGAAGVALAGSIAAFVVFTPDNTSSIDGDDISRLTLMIFIIGLLVYGVRICAQGYRSSRHLEAVARSKEAALSTFTRFSSQFESEDIRAAAALALAQAAFAIEETGLIDGSTDQVTVIERALATRLPTPGN